MTDFETMPVGTAAMLREVATHLRAEHDDLEAVHKEALEKTRCANGSTQHSAFAEIAITSAQHAGRVAEMIGKVEALLDRSHAAGAVG